jgi:hypothetical protein
MLDKFTFGNSQTAIDLVDILEEYNNKKYVKKVSAFLHKHNVHVNWLIEHDASEFICLMYRQHLSNIQKEYYSNENILPKRISGRMFNLIITKLKYVNDLLTFDSIKEIK